MSHSVSPLGSLSSPSPSPPPNPIDESELSELTDDDHDTKIVSNTNHSLDDDDDDQQPPPRPRKTTSTPSTLPKQRQRQRKSLPATTYSSRTPSAPSSSKRKKRGGLVPQPMWGWARKDGQTDSPTCTSLPGQCPPPHTNPTPLVGPSNPPDNDPTAAPFPFKSASTTPDVEEEEEEELPTPPRAMEEEEGEEPDPRKDRPLNRRRPQPGQSPRPDPGRKKIVVPMPFDYSKMPRSKRGVKPLARICSYKNEQMLKSLWERGYKLYDPDAPTSEEEDGQNENDPSNEHDSSVDSEGDEMDVVEDADDQDPTPPRLSPTRPTLNTALKPTPPTFSIDLNPENQSVPPSIRASVDPTTSPPDEDIQPDVTLDEDVGQDNDPDALEDDDQQLAPDRNMEVDEDEDEDIQPEEPSQPPSPTPLAEPEPEPEDEDLDLQPAHRAEALDVLATIELKFALLRESVYVEKMEDLAWEESLVSAGTHPELHHLQSELTKRYDKRLMLASKKRSYEMGAVTRKKHEEETWCWEGWDLARTDLQIDMIAETNRKRRKLERERRSAERPPPARRIPNAILNPPPAPTLRQIANIFPLPSHLSHLAINKKLYTKGLGVYPRLDGSRGVTAYPDLPTLPTHDIAADLEFLFQHRRMGYGFGMGFGHPISVPMGVSVGYNSSTSGFGPATMGFAGPVETYPPNPGPGIAPSNNPTSIGGPPLGSGAMGSLAVPTPSSAPSQGTPNGIAPGPGISNADGSSFSQPAMGVFQAPPSIGTGPPGYPLDPGVAGASIVIGPGGTTSTPTIGPGGARTQRPSSFGERERELQRERERDIIQRDREIRERDLTPRDRDLVAQRERDMRDRERDFGPNGYPAWGGDARRREEKERIERNERDRERERSQVQPIVPTPTHRHAHQLPHSHAHTHQLQQHHIPPHQPHLAHANQSHSHQHSQHPSHHHPHGSHSHQHTQHQHGSSHAPPHHHVGQHHHHRHHHHVVHHHHSESNSSHPQSAGPTPGVQTIEIMNLSANSSSKSHWKRDEAKLGGNSIPGSRPPSTHPPPPSHNYDDRERERERAREREGERENRPIATPFVLGPSHHTISSTASSPRHGWTPGSSESGPGNSNAPSGPFSHPPERFHTPVPHRFPNPAANGNGMPQLPRPLTTSPPRAPPSSSSTASPSISSMNAPPSSASSTGPFPLPRKPSPALPKLGMPPLGYSPRLAGPGVVPPTGPGVPGVLSATGGGLGVTPSGILTSGPGVPPGPGIAPASSVGGPSVEGNASSIFAAGRTSSPLIPYNAGPPPVVAVSTQRVSVDGP